MSNRWKHILIPVLAMALCLSLAACGNSDDVAGEDWRTTGVVVGSGTITHDGESVDVLVTVSESSAAFYRDFPEQVLFDSVAFPETIEDISRSAFQISFDDQNGDGESDVLVEIGHEDMSNTTMLWLWDPQERFVYQPEYSSFHVPGVAEPEELIASYVGFWEYQGVNLWLRIRELHFGAICCIPEGYDGLVFAAEAQSDNYKDSAKRMQPDSISPDASIMDIDTVDPYRSLYFSFATKEGRP